ncbi:MAG: GTP-binding protein [Promethearchaeia archaeon]
MNIEEKIPINFGLFGHIDSGKTAVASVLSEIISTAGIDAHPQSKERGITIDIGFTSFLMDEYLITLVDGPGHADLIKISASSVEIIDCALLVIDINKGPQIQTGEHLVMIESLGIENIIVVLNKIDLFKGNIEKEIENIQEFFKTTSFGKNVPIFAVSAKEKKGFTELKEGIFDLIKSLEIDRDTDGDVIIPIDHHFTAKGLGPIITGTLITGTLKKDQQVYILPINETGKVKNIQIFHEDVDFAEAGNRVGVNIKNIDIDKVYRGTYVTDNKNAFEFCTIAEVIVNKTEHFKPKTEFGTQVHVTIGMETDVANIYPYKEIEGKRLKKSISQTQSKFRAILRFNKRILIPKNKVIFLLSRLDLPPTTLRIIGSANLLKTHEQAPLFYKYKYKKGRIKYLEHSEGIVCEGLAQSVKGAKEITGRELEAPFTKILGSFGTKGAVIVGTEEDISEIDKSEPVILKELRSFHIK